MCRRDFTRLRATTVPNAHGRSRLARAWAQGTATRLMQRCCRRRRAASGLRPRRQCAGPVAPVPAVPVRRTPGPHSRHPRSRGQTLAVARVASGPGAGAAGLEAGAPLAAALAAASAVPEAPLLRGQCSLGKKGALPAHPRRVIAAPRLHGQRRPREVAERSPRPRGSPRRHDDPPLLRQQGRRHLRARRHGGQRATVALLR